MKLAPTKCEFFKRKVKYVGHVVSEHGVEIDPAKTEKVKEWPRPTTPEDVRKFLGFLGNPRIPVGLRENEKKLSTKFIQELRGRMAEAHRLAQAAAEKARGKQKDNYDTKVKGGTVKEGDRVLVKVVAFEGKHKLADRWDHDPYVLISQKNEDIPVFVVRKENGEGRTRTVHRNLLLPIGILRDRPTPAPRRATPRQLPAKEPDQTQQDRTEYTSSDEESVWVHHHVIEEKEQSDSGSTITGADSVQRRDDDSTEAGGDAHQSEDTITVNDSQSDVEDNGSASKDQEETTQRTHLF